MRVIPSCPIFNLEPSFTGWVQSCSLKSPQLIMMLECCQEKVGGWDWGAITVYTSVYEARTLRSEQNSGDSQEFKGRQREIKRLPRQFIKHLYAAQMRQRKTGEGNITASNPLYLHIYKTYFHVPTATIHSKTTAPAGARRCETSYLCATDDITAWPRKLPSCSFFPFCLFFWLARRTHLDS